MRVLNITNGDGAAGIIKASTVQGDVLPWRDPMHHGPFPEGLSLDELRPVRAQYLAGPEGDLDAVERDIQLRDDHLKASASYDRVVLWFEHDLLDQLQIIQILDWFASVDLGSTELEIICIDRFPGKENFRGLGELDPAQMASLSDKRKAVTEEMLRQAQAGWRAFCSSDPSEIIGFIEAGSPSLPFLEASLLRHLEEFPSSISGLNRTEEQIVSLVSRGVHSPVDLFLQNMELETNLYLGDWRTYSVIDGLCRAGLLTCETDGFWHPPKTVDDRRAFRDQRLVLTDNGKRVFEGQLNAFDLLERDEWLGGVHIHASSSLWTWDSEKKKPFLKRKGNA